jgi:prevent-host-death family protein
MREGSMSVLISAKDLRARLPEVVRRTRQGTRFTVLYRSRPAFEIVPAEPLTGLDTSPSEDSLYRAAPVGGSREETVAVRHDEVLYR